MAVVQLALLLTLALTGQNPAGGTSAVDFRWDAPSAGCPDEAEVSAEVERLLGRSLAGSTASPAQMTAIARVRQEGATWDLRLWTVQEGHTRFRVVTAESCDLVAQAGALITAMAIDPQALTRGSAEAGAVAEAAEARAEEVESAPPQAELELEDPPAENIESEPLVETRPPEALPARRRPQVRIHLLGGLNYGTLPKVGGMAELGASVGGKRASFDFGVLGLPAYGSSLPAVGADASIDLHLVGASFLGCYRPELGERLSLPLCGGGELGAVIARARGFEGATNDAIPWVALTLRPSFFVRVAGAWHLGFGAQAVLGLSNARFEVAGLGEVYAPTRFAVRAFAGLSVDIGRP
jgi:hypothetical protein